MKRPLHPIAAVVALVLVYVGFRWVTQAGQGLDAVQNDGYGGTGGLFILVGGVLFGMWLATRNKK